MIESIAVFLVITLGLGSITRFCGWSQEDTWERLFISLGVGLLAIPVIATIFNIAHIPIDFKNFIALALACVFAAELWDLRHKTPHRPWKQELKYLFTLSHSALLIIFAVTLYMYLKGSFSYPWFEDYDPWLYAASTKFIALERTYTSSFWSRVSQPYPQGFQIIMAIIHQANTSINWTLKFFTCMIVSLSLPFFYFFTKKMFFNKWTALFATIALFSIPAWLTHFIFPFALSMTSIPIFFYVVRKAEENKRWYFIAGILFASIWLIHFYSSFIITLMLGLYWLTKSFCENKIDRPLIVSGIYGFSFSIICFWIPSLYKFKDEILINLKVPAGLHVFIFPIREFLQKGYWFYLVIAGVVAVLFLATFKIWLRMAKKVFQKISFRYSKLTIFLVALALVLTVLLLPVQFMRILGSGSILYTVNHFILLDVYRNLIQNPFGIGIVPILMGALAFLYCLFILRKLFNKEHKYLAIVFVWGIFTFLGVNSARFSLNLMPFRMWSFFAFSIALLTALCYNLILANKKLHSAVKICITVLLVSALGYSWHSYKYKLNSKPWKEAWLTTVQSQELYVWLQDNIPKNSKVYALGMDQCAPIVFDMVSFPWDAEVNDYKVNDIDESPSDNYEFLKSKGYEYVLLDVSSVIYHFNYTHHELHERLKNALFVKNYRVIIFKKEIMKKQTDKFELMKDLKESGAIFKLL
ncbi:hypothetical protein ACFL38_00690 [Candidatus Omnitrophota bacterium]